MRREKKNRDLDETRGPTGITQTDRHKKIVCDEQKIRVTLRVRVLHKERDSEQERVRRWKGGTREAESKGRLVLVPWFP